MYTWRSGVGEASRVTPGGTEGLRTGRPYVVVSADAHAAPDDLDAFLSYVDPAHREAGGGLR